MSVTPPFIPNANEELKKLRTVEDKLADKITAFAGSMKFVYFHIVWFGLWIAAGADAFGEKYVFDEFPFGLLTMIVSLEAIFLATFVMISQNRQARVSEIRGELDYRTDTRAEKEIDVIIRMLERVAKEQGVEVADLVTTFAESRQQTPLKLRKH
jgi:uncharacterized membrane protein